jgi:WD40 repeat protein
VILERSCFALLSITAALGASWMLDARADDGRPSLVVQVGHTADIVAARISPDGQQLLTAGGTVAILWDLQSGREIREFANSSTLTDAVFVPRTDYVAASGQDGTTRVWSSTTGQTVRVFQSQLAVWNLAASPDGKYLAFGGNDGIDRRNDGDVIFVEEIDSGRPKATLSILNPGALAFMPDSSKLLLSGYEMTVGRLDLANPTPRISMALTGLASDSISVDGSGHRASFSTPFAYGVIDLTTGRPIWTRGNIDPNTIKVQTALSPDGSLVAIRVPGKVQLWSLDGGARLMAEHPIGEVTPVEDSFYPQLSPKLTFSPDSRTLAVAERRAVLILDAPTLEIRRRIDAVAAPISFTAVDISRRWLSILDRDGRLNVIDLTRGRPVYRRLDVTRCRQESERSALLFSDASGGILELDLDTLKESIIRPATQLAVQDFDLSPNAAALAIVDERHDLWIRKRASGE